MCLIFLHPYNAKAIISQLSIRLISFGCVVQQLLLAGRRRRRDAFSSTFHPFFAFTQLKKTETATIEHAVTVPAKQIISINL